MTVSEETPPLELQNNDQQEENVIFDDIVNDDVALDPDSDSEEETKDKQVFSLYDQFIRKLLKHCPRLKDVTLESHQISGNTGMFASNFKTYFRRKSFLRILRQVFFSASHWRSRTSDRSNSPFISRTATKSRCSKFTQRRTKLGTLENNSVSYIYRMPIKKVSLMH